MFELGASVKTLDAANNRLTSLPPAVSALSSVQRLVRLRSALSFFSAPRRAYWARQVLSGNALAALPPSLCGLVSLKVLILDDNALTVLPDALGSLTKLEKLSLAGNKLTVLPSSLGQLSALRSLVVARNALQSLPDALRGCASLEELDASQNALNAVPAALGELTRLRSLLLVDNQLRTLPSQLLLGCVALSTLLLHGNPISLEALDATPGWKEAQERTRGKNAKRVAGGVLLGDKGLDDGLDHKLTRVIVPHT